MDFVIADIVNTFDTETPHKKTKIRNIQCWAHGYVLHEVRGTFKNRVPVQGGSNLNFLCNGGMTKKLRTVFDPVGLNPEPDTRTSLIVVPVIYFKNNFPAWRYEVYPYQDLETAFDRSLQPIEISIKDFELRDWKEGLTKIPVTFKPYRSEKTGAVGMNYVAGGSAYVNNISIDKKSLSDRFRKKQQEENGNP